MNGMLGLSKKKYRKGKASLLDRVREHEQKIEEERQKPNPDIKLIDYWGKEISKFEKNITKKEKRISKK